MEAILFRASNLKVFCSSWGQNCPLEAKYCHKCGDHLQQDATEQEASVDELIDHFTVVCLVAWPLNESEAGGDLILIETSLLFLC